MTSNRHWPRSKSLDIDDDSAYYVDEDEIVPKDQVEECLNDKKFKDRYTYNRKLNLFGTKDLVDLVVELDSEYRHGNVKHINLKMAKDLLKEIKRDEHAKREEKPRSRKSHLKSVKEYIASNMDRIIDFITKDQSGKYFNIITMNANSALPSHHVSNLEIKILVPKILTDSMKEDIDLEGFTSLDVLHMAENMILEKIPRLKANRITEEDEIIEHSDKDAALRKLVNKLDVKSTARSLSVNKVKGKSAIEDPPKRLDLGRSRVDNRKIITVVGNERSEHRISEAGSALFNRLFGNRTQAGTSSRGSDELEEFADEEEVISYGEAEDINYEREEGFHVTSDIDEASEELVTESENSDESDESEDD
jgi:hypothetical protein